MQIRLFEGKPGLDIYPPEGQKDGFLFRIRNRFAIALGFYAHQGQRWWGVRIGVFRFPERQVRLFGLSINPVIRFAYRTKGFDHHEDIGDKVGWHWPFVYRTCPGRQL